MSKTLIGVIVAAAVVLAMGGILSSTYNQFVDLEERLAAQHDQTRNVYAAITNEMRSQGLAVERYQAAVLEAIDAALTGRYGQQGVDAAILLMREQNPEIAPEVFLKLQAVISSAYARFERAQAVKLDIAREYRSALRRFPGNAVAGVLGFPQTDLEALNRIVVNPATADAFATGSAGPVDPFAKTQGDAR